MRLTGHSRDCEGECGSPMYLYAHQAGEPNKVFWVCDGDNCFFTREVLL